MTDGVFQQLFQRAKQGEHAALGELLATHRQYIRFLASIQVDRRLQGKADASDLAQETCLEVHRHFPQFRGQSEPEFMAWMRSILAGIIANHVRRYWGTKGRDARLERELAVELDDTSCILDRGLAAGDQTPSEQVAHRESVQQLADALQNLPDDYRQVIVLRNFDRLPFAAIALRMSRSVDSVQKLWVRALMQLRNSMSIDSENG